MEPPVDQKQAFIGFLNIRIYVTNIDYIYYFQFQIWFSCIQFIICKYIAN